MFNSYFDNLVISFIKWFSYQTGPLHIKEAIILCGNIIVKSHDLQSSSGKAFLKPCTNSPKQAIGFKWFEDTEHRELQSERIHTDNLQLEKSNLHDKAKNMGLLQSSAARNTLNNSSTLLYIQLSSSVSWSKIFQFWADHFLHDHIKFRTAILSQSGSDKNIILFPSERHIKGFITIGHY